VNELLQAIPAIKRARAYRLYDFYGKRYLDLYQQNGYAILGHRPTGLTRALKQACSKGLIADLPSIYPRRLEKVIKKLLPEYNDVRIASSFSRALELASLYLKREITRVMIKDPIIDEDAGLKAAAAYWRPFLALAYSAEVVIPILPFNMAAAPVVICFKKKLRAGFPVSDVVSPLLLSGLIRASFDLLSYQPAGWYSDELLKDAPRWRQKGIYLVAQFGKELYGGVFQSFLKEGFLLSPFYPGPSLLPRELSEGELEKMLKLFKRIPGK
jgi:hypothetical protein